MEAKTIKQMQAEHLAWVTANFPESLKNPWQGILGIIEEMGEATSASFDAEEILQHQAQNGDSHLTQEHKEGLKEFFDAFGDIFVYMMSLCNAEEWDLETIVSMDLEDDDQVYYTGGIVSDSFLFSVIAGKLAHSFLKRAQNIRGTREFHSAAIQRLLAQLFQLMDEIVTKYYENSMENICNITWNYVQTRNWTKDPLQGGVPSNL